MNNKDKIIKKLRNSSMSYLARYEVSTYQFENTLKRKMSYYENDLKEEEKNNILILIKEEMLKAKFIDDKRYAEIKTRSLRREGGSIRFIYAKLKEKGISNEIIQSSIEMVDNGHENPEIKAAIQFMKKKSIGIFSRKNSIDDEKDKYNLKQKWLGSLSRKGFSLETIKKVIDINDINNANLILEE